ncbi:MAG: hypothetical protein IPP17_00590 [Bacteroidetes bacterium]|nr:hypothetical protein [Bacteroidota bacterium]
MKYASVTSTFCRTIQQYMTKDQSRPSQLCQPRGYWKMDEGTGLSVADSGPNGLTGTRNGTTWAVSGAAIGDDNTVLYGAPTSATVTNLDGRRSRPNQQWKSDRLRNACRTSNAQFDE